MANITRLNSNQIKRIESIEKEYGIKDMKIYAYIDEGILRIHGQIFSDKILDEFTLKCSGYDSDDDLVFSEENSSYGSGVVTHQIKHKVFYNGFPFSFWISEYNDSVEYIRIIVEA